MSFGFSRHPAFRLAGAADAENGKPSMGRGRLECNRTYSANLGLEPLRVDLATARPGDLRRGWRLADDPTVLLACPPCTGFSRTLARNHLVDDARNTLVQRVAVFAEELRPAVIVMENARELLMGRFAGHFDRLADRLAGLGYDVQAGTHFLTEFGLPQKRERALVLAVADGLPSLGLHDLWDGYTIDPSALHVRRAIGHLPRVRAGERHPSDAMHVSPRIGKELSRRRLDSIPRDGGSWVDLIGHPDADELLTPAMARRAAAGDFGSHPDVYGRLSWDAPAATVKRECGHIGNGRYTHPEQNRLCTVRELALLQGFPDSYRFEADSLTNMYRHIGDAVPPLVSYQLAAVAAWILGADRPVPDEFVLPGTSLEAADICHAEALIAA
jgi:DNA (cytosine-5)-methyltransferase 1